MKKAGIFAIAVCLFSWGAFGILYAVCGGDVTSHRVLFSLFESLYMFFPMIVAFVLQKIRKEPVKSTGLLNFKPNRIWIAAMLLPLVITGLSILISGLMPGVSLHFGPEQLMSQLNLDGAASAALTEQFSRMSPWALVGSQIISGLVAGCTINALFAFGEEYGWRNYMAAALDGNGFWKKALFIGLVWGIWHAPLILQGHNYPQHPVLGVAMMCLFCILLGAIELYLVLKSRSVFPAAIMHGTINAVAGIALYFVKGGNDLTVGATGLAGFIAIALVLAAVCIWDRYGSKERIIKK